MENVVTCLVLLLLVVVSGIISRLNHAIPTPFIQIILGALASLIFPTFHAGFNPEMFMLLFIPPLLFSDSWHFPKREFFLNTRPIIMLSIGLVFFTVAGLGHLLHWLVPTIPLPACFALAAALSPTDAVALKSITKNAELPERIRHILQGEALLNDASGLVSFKFSIVAMLTGFFSFTDASLSLLIMGGGGALIGIILTYVVVSALGKLNKKNDNETSTENLLLILLPYAAYLAAEYFDCSGVLAAVAAGFFVDKAGFLDKTMVNMRIEGRFVWGMLEVTLNGVIFILLGLYLPNSYKLLTYTDFSITKCFSIVIMISFSLILLRFIWIYLTLPLEALIAKKRHSDWRFPDFRVITAFSLGGIRGAIALAAILSVPILLPDGSLFPERDLLITIVVGVVLCSLIISAVFLPLLAPYLKQLLPPSAADEEFQAIIAASQAAITAIANKVEQLITELNEQERELCHRVANALIASLNQFIALGSSGEHEQVTSKRAIHFEEVLRLAALDAARSELKSLRKKGKINNTTLITITHILDLRQLSFTKNAKNH